MQANSPDETSLDRALLSRLVSQDWRDRQEAMETLTKRVSHGDVDRLVLARLLILVVRENHTNMSALSSSMQVLAEVGQPVSGELIRLLHDEDLDLRIYVPLVLGHLGGQDVINALIDGVNDPRQPENVRFNAIDALGMLRAQQAVPALLETLKNGSAFLQYGAIASLGEIGSEEAAAALEPLLGDPYLGEPAALALGSCGGVRNIPAICAWLERTPGGREAAVTSIGAIARRTDDMRQARSIFLQSVCPSARDHLISLAESVKANRCLDTDTQWANLALLMGWFLASDPQDCAISNGLVQLLRCRPARSEAAAALIAARGPIPEGLLRLAVESDADQALAAVHVLANLDDPAVLPALLELLQSDEEAIAVTALQGIGKFIERSTPGALPNGGAILDTLFSLLNSSRASLRRSVVQTLGSLEGWGIEDRVIDLLNHPEPFLRASSLQILAMLDLEAALRAAAAAQSDPSLEVRRAAIALLPRANQPQTVDFLRQALNDSDPGIRRAAAQACMELPATAAMPLFLKASEDADRWVRLQAARGIGKSAQPMGLNRLAEMVRDPFPPVRAAVVEAAASLSPALGVKWQDAVLEILRVGLADEDPSVRQAAEAGVKSFPTDHHNGS